jgi:hypothetical protein
MSSTIYMYRSVHKKNPIKIGEEERMGKTLLSNKEIFLSAIEKNSSLLSAGRRN